MLKTYINTIPYTKFILITDSLKDRDLKLFDFLVSQHLNKKQHKIHFCVFQSVFKRTLEKFQSYSNIALHNFVTDVSEKSDYNLETLAEKLGSNDIIVIDSLANAIFRYGLAQTYRILNTLKNNKALKQVIAVLHQDLIQEDTNKVYLFFCNLSTLSIKIQPKFMTDTPRVQYEYKKAGGKVISEIEEYTFNGDQFITNEIAKPDASKLLEKSVSKEINPEEMSTFRIGLTDEEKLSRDQLVLPYLPKANEDNLQENEGKIFYQLDDVDDWDEEDPDDDLDI